MLTFITPWIRKNSNKILFSFCLLYRIIILCYHCISSIAQSCLRRPRSMSSAKPLRRSASVFFLPRVRRKRSKGHQTTNARELHAALPSPKSQATVCLHISLSTSALPSIHAGKMHGSRPPPQLDVINRRTVSPVIKLHVFSLTSVSIALYYLNRIGLYSI
jgi:hypothetical protein